MTSTSAKYFTTKAIVLRYALATALILSVAVVQRPSNYGFIVPFFVISSKYILYDRLAAGIIRKDNYANSSVFLILGYVLTVIADAYVLFKAFADQPDSVILFIQTIALTPWILVIFLLITALTARYKRPQ